MKRNLIASAVAVLFLCSAALAPGKIKEKDVLGKWKLHLDISEKIKEETEDEEGLGKAFARGIGELVDEIISKVDITFEFKKNNVLIVTHNSDWDDDEDEVKTKSYHWSIDKDGKIQTNSLDKHHVEFDDHDGWILKDGKLFSIDEYEESEKTLWLEKIK